MSPEEVRAAGIYLNGGRRHGWKRHLARLLRTPETTVATWATRSASNARPIPGVAVVAIKLLVAMYRQELAAGPAVAQAAASLAERVAAITNQPELFPRPGPLATPPQSSTFQAEVRGAWRTPRAAGRSAPATETPPPGDPVLFEVARRSRGPRRPT